MNFPNKKVRKQVITNVVVQHILLRYHRMLESTKMLKKIKET